MTPDLVVLTIAANEFEAEMARTLLATAGIESLQRYTNVGAGSLEGQPGGGGPREILVARRDLAAARALIQSD